MSRKGFGVEYQYKIIEAVLFLGLFVYGGTSMWFGNRVLVNVVGDWFFKDFYPSYKTVSLAWLAAILVILPAYRFVQTLRGAPFFHNPERKSLNGESLTIALYGLSGLWSFLTVVYILMA